MKKICFIIFVSYWLLINPVLAAGLAVKPSSLDFFSRAHQSTAQSINITNISNQPALYHLYTEDLIQEFIIQPADFKLNPGESTRVKITYQPKSVGLFLTNLAIVAQDLDRREFNIDSGVKVPLTLRVEPALISAWQQRLINLLIIIGVLLAAAVILFIIDWRRRQKHWYNKTVDYLFHHKKWWRNH